MNKGNAAQRAEAERQLAEVTHMLALAEREAADGALGASRWVEAQRRQCEGLTAILAVHDNSAIADGTLVHVGRGPTIYGDGRPAPSAPSTGATTP